MAGIADVKADLVAVQADLDAIKSGIAGLTGPLQAQIDTLKQQISDMTAADEAQAAQIADALTTADSVKASADAIAALVTPPA